MQAFEINHQAKKQVLDYLANQQITLPDAMNQPEQNKDIAAILHSNLPTMVRKIYSLNKFQTFFWEKRELLTQHLLQRLTETNKRKK